MREETVTYKVFKFEELDEKVQAKILDDRRDWNTGDFEWYDSVYERSYDDLKAKGFTDCKIWFSGFSSQGDGACFDCTSFDYEKLLNALEGSNNFKKYKRHLTKLIDAGYIGVGISTLNSHYKHEYTRSLDVDTNVYDKRCPKLAMLIEGFAKELEELRTDMCQNIYGMLEAEYESLRRDEVIKESIECNEIEFHENGKVY